MSTNHQSIWQKPNFIELCMNAEIGAYQEDTGDSPDLPPVLAPAPPLSEGEAEAAIGQHGRDVA